MKIRVPYAPLVNHMRLNDLDLAALMPHARKVDDEGEVTLVVDPEHHTEYKRWHWRLAQAEQRGWIDYFHADEFCCDLLGMHPFQVFGHEWFDMPDDKDLQDRLAGRTEKEEVAA